MQIDQSYPVVFGPSFAEFAFDAPKFDGPHTRIMPTWKCSGCGTIRADYFDCNCERESLKEHACRPFTSVTGLLQWVADVAPAGRFTAIIDWSPYEVKTMLVRPSSRYGTGVVQHHGQLFVNPSYSRRRRAA